MRDRKKREREIAGRLQVGRIYRVGTYLGPYDAENNEYHDFIVFDSKGDGLRKNLMTEEVAHYLRDIPEPDDSVMTEADREVQGMIQKGLIIVCRYYHPLGVFHGFDMLESIVNGGKAYYYFFSEGSCDAEHLLKHRNFWKE